MEDIIIKEVAPEDAAKWLDFTRLTGSETENLSFGKEGLPISVEEEADFIRYINDDPHSVAFLAWKDNEIIGSGSLGGLPRRMSHRASLGLSVAKAHWNKGIGSALLRRVIDWAGENGIEIINLEVRSDNDSAIHLYEKFGFQKTGAVPAYFKIGDKYADCDIMYLDLRRQRR